MGYLYQPKYFTIKELVHPWILRDIGEVNAWRRLEPLALQDLDHIRETWGRPIYINLGAADSRGLRPPNDPDGSKYSTHKHGTTFDLVDSKGDNKALWSHVCELIEDGHLKYMNTMEDLSFTPTWTHVGRMNTDLKPLVIKP